MKNKIMTILFLLVIFGFAIISIVLKDKDVSIFERRWLAQFPKMSSGFTENLDKYLVDQFAYRNELISLNSNINRNVLGKIDDKDVYVIGNNVYEINYPLNEKSCISFSDKMNYITEKCFNDANVYYSIIPDKCYFLDNSKYLKINYNRMYNLLGINLNAKYLDITSRLNINDYYLTDIHWKQENLQDIVMSIMKSMGKEYKVTNYYEKEYPNFYGASYSKGTNTLKPDTLKYLVNKELESAYVNHLEHGQKEIYDEEKLRGVDAYDVFMSGPSSYIEIKNEMVKDDSALVLFRDSFGSSIAPLFIPYYNKIIVIDLRYIDFRLIEEKLNYENCDVLYLYSTLIINNSSILKVNY